MRALFITVHYPPIAGTSSRAMGELSIAMANAGHQVDVLTIQPVPGHPVYRYSETAHGPAHRNIRIHRIPMGPVNRLVARAMRPAKACTSQPLNVRSSVHQLVDGFYQARRFWQLLAVPDASIDWLPSAIVKARRLVRELDPELLVSLGNPHTCHLAAFAVTRKGSCSWVPFYGDSWGLDPTLSTRPRWLRTFNQFLERKALRAATAVTVWTPQMKTSLVRSYGIEPARVLTNSLAFADLKDYEAVKAVPADGFHIVYTGNIYGALQNPVPFFRAAAKLGADELKLSFIGPISEDYRDTATRLGVKAEYPGWHPPERIVKDQKGASVLLIFGHRGGHVMPSKIYEYFAARRPILCIRADEQDMIAPLIDQHRRGLVVDNDEDQIEHALRELVRLYRESRLDSSFDLNLLPQYSAAETARSLMDAIVGAVVRPTDAQATAPGAASAS